MRLAGLSLPRPSWDRLSALGSRRGLLYAAYTFVVFLVFLLVNFPHDIVVQRALRGVDLGSVRLDLAPARFAWWRGYSFRWVRLSQEGEPSDAPPLLEASRVYVRPRLWDLIRGRLGSLSISGEVYRGTVEGSADTGSSLARATLRLRSVQIGQHPALAGLFDEGELAGRLSGTITAEGRRGSPGDGQVAGDLELADGGLLGASVSGLRVPDLHFPSASVKFSARGNRLEIQELRADGQEIRIAGSGQVNVSDRIADSALNLKGTVQAGPAGGDAVTALLSFLPRGKGNRSESSVTVTGTLGQPRLR